MDFYQATCSLSGTRKFSVDCPRGCLSTPKGCSKGVLPHAKGIPSPKGCLSKGPRDSFGESFGLARIGIDDTIFEKPHTDEREMNTYHDDHSKGKSVKGIHAVNLIHETEGIRLPLSLSIVHKDEWVEDKGKFKRKSSKTKNELFREQFLQAIHNEVSFTTVLADIWFGNGKNMELIVSRRKHFIMPLKTNRQVSLIQ